MGKKSIILLSAYVNYIFHGIGAIILSLTMLNLKQIWQASTFQVSLVISGIGLGRLIFMYFAGVLSDRLGRKKTIILASLLYFLFFAVISFMPNYQLGLVCALIAGLCQALYDTSIYPLITELYSGEKQQSSLSILNKAFISLGQFALPFIVVMFNYSTFAFHYVYLICAGGIILNLILFSFLPVNKYIPAYNKVEKLKERAKIDWQIFLLLVFSFISVTLFTIFTTWIVSYGTEYLHLTSSESSFYVSKYSLCSIISVFVTSLVVRLGVKRLYVMLFNIAITLGGLLLLLHYPNEQTLYLTTIIIGFFAAGGIWQLGLVELLEWTKKAKGKYTSYYSFAASLALFLIPSVTGYFAEKNIVNVFWIAAILAMIGVVILLILNFYRKVKFN